MHTKNGATNKAIGIAITERQSPQFNENKETNGQKINPESSPDRFTR